MKKKNLSRRSVLRGAMAGVAAAVALPPLEAMFNDNGTAHADGTAIPGRYGLFFWGSGMRADRWFPRRTGPQWWMDPNESLAPIADNPLIRESVSIVGGLECPGGNAGHHRGRAQVLTGTYDEEADRYGLPVGPSMDYVIADAWEGNTRLRSVDIGISRVGIGTGVARGTTSRGPSGEKIQSEFSPRALYDRVFGVRVETPPPAGTSTEAVDRVRRSMLDLIREDGASLRRRLGTRDQRRLDEHLESLRAIERAIEAPAALRGCTMPDRPGEDSFTDDPGHELLDEKNRVMADMIAIGLACDVTRVFTYEFTQMQADTIFWQVGATSGAHAQTHNTRRVDGERIMADVEYEMVHQSTKFTMGCFGYLCEALARMEEGDSTVLHNSAIFASSDLSDATRHTTRDMPILIAGRACGALQPGMFYRGNGEVVAEAQLTCAQALGLGLDGFGRGISRATSPISELMT